MDNFNIQLIKFSKKERNSDSHDRVMTVHMACIKGNLETYSHNVKKLIG